MARSNSSGPGAVNVSPAALEAKRRGSSSDVRALGVCAFVDQVSGTPQPSGDLCLNPSLFRGLETLVSNCPTCAETRVQCSEPMLPSATPTRPWEEVGVDLFHLNGQDYVLLVDYRSRFPEVISLRSTSAPAVINVIKSVFARHGTPRLVRSDNGPQFAAREFSAFADSYGFRYVTSSPHFPQFNGEVEWMVRTVKDLLRKADDPYLALLAYRDIPGVNGVSPAQLLMGRRLQTRVPKASHQLEPTWPPSVPFTRRDQDNRRRQVSDFNRRHAAHELRPLQAGEQVWVRDVNSPAIVMGPAQRPRSYVVETPTGVLQRNRMHLVPTTGRPAEDTTSTPGTPAAAQTAMSPTTPGADQAAQDQETASPRESTSSADAPCGSPSTPRFSRFGRKIHSPRRLDL
ncbi:uncharacterized protein LOC119435243 [Dermacentor silvarum]|uniref:uncharacterized protein LOC119435243 n=1 Tax=Dermacentor silvarum TaxID=543639 RepID=UPI001898C509|nr:uncharacterized protein LOC119435243 [Dermacentor silvarum]